MVKPEKVVRGFYVFIADITMETLIAISGKDTEPP
jgi:hypothetical protein